MRALKNKSWPWIALAGAVLAGGGGFLAYEKEAQPDTAAVAAPSVIKGALGTPVTRNGTFEYTVTSLDCGTTVAGATPKGRFCTLAVKVHNLGGAARKPGIAFAQLLDAQGAEYLADAFAQIRSDGEGASLLDELAPGSVIDGRLIYDVPRQATITSVELHESPASTGIVIPLNG